ncbi:hypothetical protein JXM67_09125 [candidate division WOR-3 bacterium]|nr:hypothetical protein [candidate division WOR-3 bacterium]
MAQKKRRISLFFLPFVVVIPLVLWNVFQRQITSYIGQTWWIVGLVVFIVLTVAGSIIPFIGAFGSFFGGGYSFFWGSSKKGKEILTSGRAAKATVVGIGEHSGGGTLTINDQPVLNLRLEIDDGYKQPYEVSFDTIVPRSVVPQFQPGAMFAVKVDPADPQKVVIDPEGAKKFQGSIAGDGKPTVGGKGWTKLDHKLLEQDGKDGMAKLLGLEDTGRSEDFNPVVAISYEVYLPGQEPYSFTKEIPIPSNYIQQMKSVVGRTFPCRVHPNDRTKINVDITF